MAGNPCSLARIDRRGMRSVATNPDPTLGREWLVRLRWGAALAQIATLAFADLALGFPPPWAVAVALLGLTAASNVALARSAHPRAMPAAVVLDVLVLTAILALTGGASNPFSVLYLLHVALAAVLLGPRWTTLVAGLAAAGFGLLFLVTDPHAMHRAGAGAMQAHLWGMWVAFAVTGAGISWFVAQLAAALRAREAELQGLRQRAEQQERVVSLATLAAGAAHELGSPLGAIAVSAREIELLAPEGSELAEEARAQRVQVDRCRLIVARLSQRAGAAQAEPSQHISITTLWAELAATLPPRDAARTHFVPHPTDGTVWAPPVQLREALGSLVRNALQAGPGPVRVEAAEEHGQLALVVLDAGVGMPPAVLARVGEPFFTTRGPGEGMGLGLFLARRFAEGLGGALVIDSQPEAGTCARLTLPRDPP